jgi:hypothetical protein
MQADTVKRFKKIYSEKQGVLEQMLQTGNDFEKIEAAVIIEAAEGSKLGGVTPATNENLNTAFVEKKALSDNNIPVTLKNVSLGGI